MWVHGGPFTIFFFNLKNKAWGVIIFKSEDRFTFTGRKVFAQWGQRNCILTWGVVEYLLCDKLLSYLVTYIVFYNICMLHLKIKVFQIFVPQKTLKSTCIKIHTYTLTKRLYITTIPRYIFAHKLERTRKRQT